MKANARYFKAVEAVVKLEQSIQRLNKGPEKTNEASGVCHSWELATHEFLAINKGWGEISKSILANTDANPFHKELRNRTISEHNDITNNFFFYEYLYSYKKKSLWNHCANEFLAFCISSISWSKNISQNFGAFW